MFGVEKLANLLPLDSPATIHDRAVIFVIRVAMIGPLPAATGAVPESGVSGYTYSLLTHMPLEASITAVAQTSVDPNIQATSFTPVRSWRPGIHAAGDIISTLGSDSFDLVHLQHEFRLFGGAFPTALVVERLRRARCIKVPVVTTMHGVVPLSKVDSNFLQRYEISGGQSLAKTAMRIAHRSIKKLSSRTIVHHKYFKDILVEDYDFDERTISVIPPGTISSNDNVAFHEKELAQTTKDLRPNVLIFGFLTSYKLPELVVQVASSMKESAVHFTFCVSRNPRADSKSYLKRYEALRKSVMDLGDKATWSDYVPDEEVPKFFEKADILVLPYVDCISTSAVASLALAHNVKICFSAPLSTLFPPSELEFELNVPSLSAAITRGLKESNSRSIDATQLVPWDEAARQTFVTWNDTLKSHHSG